MGLVTPATLTAMIEALAAKAAAQAKATLTPAAIQALTRVPSHYSIAAQGQIDVDEAKLEQAITALVRAAGAHRGPISAVDIDKAKSSSGCHYLWFC